MNVVLIHGFLNTGRCLRPLGRRLEAHGHLCHAPTLHPRDARDGIPDLSAKLAAFVGDRVPAGAPFALVGFSMGALVARHYLQSLGGARLASAFFSIAAPYKGSVNAYLYPGPGARQMRPGSPFLRSLEAQAGALAGLPVFTYRTPFDLMVVPSTGARIPGATDRVSWSPIHSLLLFDRGLGEHIAAELAKLEPRADRRFNRG